MKVQIATVLLAAALLVGCQEKSQESHATISDLPPAVLTGFKSAYPDATVKEVEKETYPDGTIHWEVKYVDKAGKAQEVELDSTGKVLGAH